MRNAKTCVAAAAVLAIAAVMPACTDQVPTASDPINITITNNNTNNNGVPGGGTPSPSPSPAGLVPDYAKVTIIGGNGSKIVPVGARFSVTYTRFKKATSPGERDIEVPGNPTDPVEWFISGAVDDLEATGPDEQNYNRDLRCKTSPGTFSASASLGGYDATLVGTCQ